MRQSFYIEVDKADLKYVMKKLQNADASKVVRVVSSSKASPKTGE